MATDHKKTAHGLPSHSFLAGGYEDWFFAADHTGTTFGSAAINGKPKDDRLTGTGKADRIDGKGGNDLIEGLGGNDTLIGGGGNDTIFGGGGDDSLDGGGGANLLNGGKGVDTAVFSGSIKNYEASYLKGRMVLSTAGLATTLDASVERLKFGSGIIDRQSLNSAEITAIDSGDGVLDNGVATIDTTVSLSGTADAFMRVRILLDGTVIGTTVANAKGLWSFDYTGHRLDEGHREFTTRADWGSGEAIDSAVSYNIFVGHAIDLTTLSASQGFIIQGDTAFDSAGKSVSSAGDVNGDGFDDILIGARGGNDGSATGEVYVVFGSDQGFGTAKTIDGVTRQVVDLNELSPSQGFVIQGDAAADFAGASVSSAGDVNGDGFEDLIVGASNGDDGGNAAGEAYVIFGGADGFGVNSVANGFTRRVLALTELKPGEGFVIQGDAANDYAGISVSAAGDVNGDGFDDLIVGASNGDDGGLNTGEAYVIFGGADGFGVNFVANGFIRRVLDLTELKPNEGFIIQGDAEGDQAGILVSSAGDIDDDGFGDLIVGAPGGDDGGNSAGEAYVVFGSGQGFGTATTTNGVTRQVIDLTTLSASQGFIIQGDSAFDNASFSASSTGDVNGDGFGDLIVGASGGGDGGDRAGEAYVVFGSDQGFGTATTIDGVSRRVIDLTTLSATQGFIIQGDAVDDQVGISVSLAGDVNGDGFDDLIVGASNGDDGGNYAGEAYVVFGSDQGFGTAKTIDGVSRQVIDLTELTVRQGFIIQGDATNDTAGRSVSSAGDVNGDGFDDLIVGAPYGDDGGDAAGEAYIVYGGTFGSILRGVARAGTSAADLLIGNAGNDILTGNGGADVFRSGAGNDRIVISDNEVRLIDGGGGDDVVVLAGKGIVFDARTFSNGQLNGIEGFDITGAGNNQLLLDATDVFHFSTVANQRFSGAESHSNTLVIDGNSGDRLQLFESGAADAGWQAAAFNRQLDGTAEGDYTFVNLVEHDTGRVLASMAVDQDVTLML